MRALLSILLLLGTILLPALSTASEETKLLGEQAKNARVKAAYEMSREKLERLFRDKGLPFPPKGVYLRAFKHEGELELWGRRGDSSRYELVATYPICAASGTLGPKRRQGDLQVPEGFYEINHFNPASNYHLSLGVSYPNASDRLLGKKGSLGGSIYVHGSCVTIGCIPLGDEAIEEVYVAALLSLGQSRARVPIHIFPSRLDEAGLAALQEAARESPELGRFWTNLAEGYQLFERERRPPRVCVATDGRYRFGSACGSSRSRGTTSNPASTSRTR